MKFAITYEDVNRSWTWTATTDHLIANDALLAARKYRKMEARLGRTVRIVKIRVAEEN